MVEQSTRKNLVLILGSCQFPADLVRQRMANKTFARINQHLENAYNRREHTIVNLMAGDTIYADATAGLFDPVDEISRFHNAYDVFKSSHQVRLLRNKQVEFVHTIDDHEIDDNWEPPDERELMLAGKRQFLQSLKHAAGAPFGKKLSDEACESHTLWRAMNLHGIPLFCMDTRTERQTRSIKTAQTAKLIDDKQSDALCQWLSQLHALDKASKSKTAAPKFILSGAMLLPRHIGVAQCENDALAGLNSDSWDGYPATLAKVLSHIGANEIQNVIFMSGDAHIPCYAKIEISNSLNDVTTTAHSIHAPPFYAPFPFANASVDDFSAIDHFTISTELDNTEFQVHVQSEFPPAGNGYALINVPIQHTGHLNIDFHTEQQPYTVELGLGPALFA